MSLINVVFHVLLIMRSNMGKGSLRTPLTNSVPSSIAAYPMWLNILKKNRSRLKNVGKIPLYDTVSQSGIWYLYLKISSLYALFTQKLAQFSQYALPAVLYGFSAAAIYFCRIRNSNPVKIKQFHQPGICIRQLS